MFKNITDKNGKLSAFIPFLLTILKTLNTDRFKQKEKTTLGF